MRQLSESVVPPLNAVAVTAPWRPYTLLNYPSGANGVQFDLQAEAASHIH